MARPNLGITEAPLNLFIPTSYKTALQELAQERGKPMSEVVRGMIELFLLPKIYRGKSLVNVNNTNYIAELQNGINQAELQGLKLQALTIVGRKAIAELQELAKSKLEEVKHEEHK